MLKELFSATANTWTAQLFVDVRT